MVQRPNRVSQSVRIVKPIYERGVGLSRPICFGLGCHYRTASSPTTSESRNCRRRSPRPRGQRLVGSIVCGGAHRGDPAVPTFQAGSCDAMDYLFLNMEPSTPRIICVSIWRPAVKANAPATLCFCLPFGAAFFVAATFSAAFAA